VKVHDEYYWFRKREDPKVLKYLEEENAFAETMMADTGDLQDLLYEECVKRDALLHKPVMRQLDDFFYYSRPQQDQQYQVHCRRYEREDNEEQIILDENLEAEGCDYFCLGAFDVSQVRPRCVCFLFCSFLADGCGLGSQLPALRCRYRWSRALHAPLQELTEERISGGRAL
jgi:protease II